MCNYDSHAVTDSLHLMKIDFWCNDDYVSIFILMQCITLFYCLVSVTTISRIYPYEVCRTHTQNMSPCVPITHYQLRSHRISRHWEVAKRCAFRQSHWNPTSSMARTICYWLSHIRVYICVHIFILWPIFPT